MTFRYSSPEKTTLVPEDLGFEEQDTGKRGGGSFHEIGSIDSANVMVTSSAFIVRTLFCQQLQQVRFSSD